MAPRASRRPRRPGAGTGPGPRLIAVLSVIALCACTPDDRWRETDLAGPTDPVPVYEGVQTRLLDRELVNFVVAMRFVRDPVSLRLYAECAAAQYAVIRGHDYLRHVRTTTTEEGGIWRADAVYTISPGLPEGLQTIDASFTVAMCERSGVPTV